MAKKKLGEILVTSGAVSGADVASALADQSAGEPSRLGDLLVATGKLSSATLARALAEQYQLPYVELPQLPQAVLDLVPLDLQRQFRIVPLKSEGTELSIAMADLANIEVLAVLEQQWTKVHVNVAGGDEIDALHATLSGIFSPVVLDDENAPPSISPFPSAEDLFGSLDLDGPDSIPSPVPIIAPVQTNDLHGMPRPSPVAPSSAPPRAEDLFGDLNLDSARTGIAAAPPEDTLSAPVRNVTMPLGAVIADLPADVIPPPPASPPAMEGEAMEAEAMEGEVVAEMSEGSGPVVGIKEGTGPLLDMLFQEGSGSLGDLLIKEDTGSVVDTPFFQDSAVRQAVPPITDPPFTSSRSSLSALAIPPPQPTVPAPEVRATAPEPAPAPSPEALPDWLRTDAAPAPKAAESATWTGALDHLMPSKLVVGLTRALLARGLVTEEEILAALGQGQKK